MKKVYDEYDSDGDDGEWESHHVAMVVEEPTACDEEGLDSLTTSAAEMGYGMTIEAREPNEGDQGTEQSQEYEPRQDRKRQRKEMSPER